MKSRPGGKVLSCASCGLYKDCKNPRRKPTGKFKKRIINIGEAPDQRRNTQMLERAYEAVGIDLHEDCLNINAVNCPTPDGRPPTKHEMDCCRAVMVDKIIDEYDPQAIVLLGNPGLYSFMGNRWRKDLYTIGRWRGFAIPDREFDSWVFPIYDPGFVAQAKEDRRGGREVQTIWKQDLERLAEQYNTDLPRWPKPDIRIIEDLEVLKHLNSNLISIDYETTGLKPHGQGHRIVSCSISPDENTAYAFVMPKTRKGRQPLIDLLQNKHISKIAHHMKFEDMWTRHRLRTDVEGWAFDSMLAAHLLDNRPNITGLKFQAYVNLGVLDYDETVGPYLRSVDAKGGNSHNRILELLDSPTGLKNLLTYNALDTIYEYRVAKIQMRQMNFDFLPF